MSFYHPSLCFPHSSSSTSLGYILNICEFENQLFISGINRSSNYLAMLDMATLSLVSSFGDVHDGTLTDMCILDSNVICTSSRDGSFKLFDIRNKNCVLSGRTTKEIASISSHKSILAVSNDCNVMLYDIRRNQYIHEYLDIHSQSVSKLKMLDSQLISAGEDGIINILEFNHEDPLLTINTGSDGIRSVNVIDKHIYSYTSTECMHIHDMQGSVVMDACTLFRDSPMVEDHGSVGYIIDNTNDMVLCGSSSGNILLLDMHANIKYGFSKHHTEVVRCGVVKEGYVITGAEDGQVILWKTGQEDKVSATGDKGKKTDRVTTSSRPY